MTIEKYKGLRVLLQIFAYTVLAVMFYVYKPIRLISWKNWFYAFAFAQFADIASTFYFLHITGWDWTQESNELIRVWSRYIGFPNAFAVHSVFFLFLVYLLTILGRQVESSAREHNSRLGFALCITGVNMIKMFVALMCLYKLEAAVHNTGL